MRPNPYIGITGFMFRREVEQVLDALPPGCGRQVMVGLLVSDKTLQGIPNKYPRRYPKAVDLKDIFTGYESALNLIHFKTKDEATLYLDMVHAQELAGPNCHGFQLNVAWPDPKILERYKKACFKRREVVLQCGEGALNKVEGKPEKLAERVQSYDGLIDHVLIDPSGGVGRDFDEELAYDYFWALRARMPTLGLGIAGGLHAGNLSRLSTLLECFGCFNIDVEGKVRDPQTDTLNVPAASRYLTEAHALYSRHEVAA